MAIEWTNNSTDNLNLWNLNDQATWTVTDDGDAQTGVIPDWIRTGDFDDRPQFYFANTRERMMMVDNGADTPGDTYRGQNGQVSYDTTTHTLTMSEPLRLELNNWTVQVTQSNGSGVFRWPGWGGMTDTWADPGCHAWDLNEGDLTHQIMRTFELDGADGRQAVDEMHQPPGGTWRMSYQLGDTVMTRDVTLPRHPEFVYVPFDIDWSLTVANPCDSAPWTVSKSNTRLHYRVTDSSNCGGPCSSIQAGTATANIRVGSTPVNMWFVFEGIGEREMSQYELMDFTLNGTVIARGHAPGGGKRCAMGPIVQQNLGSGPPYLLQANTDYVFRCNFTTADHLYHVGCYYQVDLVFDDA